MRRLPVFALLLLCLGGVVLLLMESGEERSAGRRGALSRDAADESARGGSGGTVSEAGTPTRKATGRDDDPNRTDGPHLIVRGVVTRDGRGAAGATVTIQRAHARLATAPPGWATGEYARAAQESAVIATCATDASGRFLLTVSRRSALVVEARATGCAPGRKLLWMPVQADPEPITIELGAPLLLEGLVVDGENQPIAGAEVRLATNSWRMPTVTVETRSDAAGRFGFADLAEATYALRVTAEGWAASDQWITLPLQRQVVVQMLGGGAILGHVRDRAGLPITGANVRIRSGDEARKLSGWTEATTDEMGAYRIAAAMPGWITSAVVRAEPTLLRSSMQGQITLPLERVVAGEEFSYEIEIERGATLEGRAVTEGAGRAVPGAAVTLMLYSEQFRTFSEVTSVFSDADGRFRFADIPEGSYGLEAKAPGLARLIARFVQPQENLLPDVYVVKGTPPGETRIELAPAGSVGGRVLGLRDGSLASAGVQLQGVPKMPTATLDDAGRFDFPMVPETPSAVIQCWNPQCKSDSFAVQAGAHTEVDLDATLRRGWRGLVVDAAGEPIAEARVRAVLSGSLERERQSALSNPQAGGVASDAQGQFAVDAPDWMRQNAGKQKWALIVTRRGFLPHTLGDLTLPEGDTIAEVRITLDRGGVISGEVAWEGGGPAAGVYVWATAEGRDPPTGTLGAYSDFDGAFLIEGAADGEYTLGAYHMDAQAEGVKTAVGDPPRKLVLRKSESIEGLVVDSNGAPIPQFAIFAITASAAGEQRRGGTAAGGGRFRIVGLDRGSYAIEVSPGTQQGAKLFEVTRSEPVPSGTLDLVIRVGPGLRILGQVHAADGEGVGGADVIALPLVLDPKEAKSTRRPHTRTDAHGNFSLDGLREGEVELVVVAAGHLPATRKATPGPDRIRIDLEEGASLEARLLLPDGTPASNQWVSVLAQGQEAAKQIMDWTKRGGTSWQSMGAWRQTNAYTDGEGAFRLRGLTPGVYRLFVSRSDAAVPDAELRTGVGVQTVRLESPRKLQGRLVDAAGASLAPAKGVTWYATAHRGEVWLRSAQVDEEGSFLLDGLPPGPLTLQIHAPPYAAQTLEVHAGGAEIAVTLQPAPGR